MGKFPKWIFLVCGALCGVAAYTAYACLTSDKRNAGVAEPDYDDESDIYVQDLDEDDTAVTT